MSRFFMPVWGKDTKEAPNARLFDLIFTISTARNTGAGRPHALTPPWLSERGRPPGG